MAYKSHLGQHSGTLQEVDFVSSFPCLVYLTSCQKKSTCSSHNAVNMADTKALQGLAATSVGTIDCTWHNMKLPNGIGDLQKGER